MEYWKIKNVEIAGLNFYEVVQCSQQSNERSEGLFETEEQALHTIDVLKSRLIRKGDI